VPVEIGQEAPDFTLKDQDGNDVTLSSFRGNQSVVVVFYPFTFTGVCQGELCSLRDDLSEFQAVKAQVLAISCDSRHAQKQWSKEQGFTFPVLSDFWPHGAVARAYGVFNEHLVGRNGKAPAEPTTLLPRRSRRQSLARAAS